MEELLVILFGSFSKAVLCRTQALDFTKVHLHVEYINRNEVCVSCWLKNESDTRSFILTYYHLYNQANPDEHIKDRGPCNKSLSPQDITARLSVQQGVTVECRGYGNQHAIWINVTVFPLSSDDNDSLSNTTGIDSGMILKCNSTFDHNASCWKLSYIHVSNEDVYCNVNNSVAIISTFTPSLYPDIELEDVPMLLRALDSVYNFDELENSCVNVIVSYLQYSTDITPSVTPESACPQSTPCPEQIPCVEQATDALNQIIQDKPTYVLASFPVVVVMFVLLVLATAIILILAICYCKQKRDKQQYILQIKKLEKEKEKFEVTHDEKLEKEKKKFEVTHDDNSNSINGKDIRMQKLSKNASSKKE